MTRCPTSVTSSCSTARRRAPLAWEELLTAEPVDLETAAHVAAPDDLVTVIYTSGTTGEPKGVMLDHANICWTIESLRLALPFSSEGFRLVSYLPMAHIAERVTTHYGGVVNGYEVTTCPDLHFLANYLGETQAGAAVRRAAHLREDPQRDPRRARRRSGQERRVRPCARGGPRGRRGPRAAATAVAPELARAFEEADAALLGPVRQLLGLDALRVAVTAAAPIPVEILQFFRALGVPLSEMYGLSESSGPATWEAERVRLGTVGRAIPGVELRLGDDGEVILRGGNVFRGYLDDPAQTAEVLDADGWLHTGDIGELDGDGYLRIVDRKKELIITAGGKNISPANLEAALKAQPLIGQAAAIGDGQPYVVALLVLDPDVAPVWAAQHGVTASTLPELAADPAVLAEIDARGRRGEPALLAHRTDPPLRAARRRLAARLRRAHAHDEAQATRHRRQVRGRDRRALLLIARGDDHVSRARGLRPRAASSACPARGDELDRVERMRRIARDPGRHGERVAHRARSGATRAHGRRR